MSYIFAVIFTVLIVVADQISKYLVITNFALGDSVPLIEGIINLTYIHNNGAAFGILKNQRWFFLAVTAVIMIICITMLIRKTYKSKWMYWAICIVLGGGLGNMIDRAFRGGNVIDFLEFGFFDFPIFNLADIAVSVGAVMIFIYFLRDMIKDVKGENDAVKAYSDELLEEVEENKEAE